MKKFALLGFLIFLNFTAVSQNFTFIVQVDKDVIASVAKNQISELIKKQNLENTELGDPQIIYKSGAVETTIDITRKEKTFFGEITVTGELKSMWLIGMMNEDIVVRRGKIQFTNKNKSFSLLDDVISGIAKNFLPEEIPLKKEWLENELNRAATAADFMNLKFQKLNLGLKKLTSLEKKIELTISGSGILASQDMTPLSLTTGALVVSRQWMLNMINLQLKPNQKLEVENVSLRFEDKSWIVESDAVYHFKWLWLIPDEIHRKVNVNLTPTVVDSTMYLRLNDAVVYKNEPDEFSLINGYIEGKISDEFKKYEYPLNSIPKEFRSVTDQFSISGKIEKINLTSLTTVDDRVILTPELKIQLNVDLKR